MIVFIKPSFRPIFGFQFNFDFANVMSGFLTFGSSTGNFLNTILLLLFVSFLIRCTSFRIEISFGFPTFTGSFIFDDSSPANNFIEIQLTAKDIDTAVEKRDKHLRSPDFFNAGEYPIVSFKSTSVKKIAKDTYEVSGTLTLLGNTRPLSVKVQETGSGKDPWGNFRRGFETSFTIKRSEFGMNFMLAGVSDEVAITVSVGGIRQ